MSKTTTPPSDNFSCETLRTTRCIQQVSARSLCPSEDVPGSVHVTINHEPTDAPMRPNRQSLFDYLAALAAGLACVLCVNQCHLNAGAFSLANQDLDEAVPACIRDTPAQPAVPQHPLNVEAFRNDEPVSVNQRTSDLMVEVTSTVRNFLMQRHHPILDGASPIASALASIQCPLALPKFWQCPLQGSTIAQAFAARRCDKCLQANVDTNASRMLTWLVVRKLDRKADIPLAGTANDCCFPVLGRLGYFSMPAHANGSNELQPQLAIDNSASATVWRGIERKRVESVGRFEPWKSRFAAHFNATEKRAVCSVELPKRPSCRSGVDCGNVWIGFAMNSKPSALLDVAPFFSGCFPAENFPFESPVIETPVCLKCAIEFALLGRISEQSKFI